MVFSNVNESYNIKLIDIKTREKLMDEYMPKLLYEEKADIYGCCIKLLTDDGWIRDRWTENFYNMYWNVRSHGRIIVTKDDRYDLIVLYDPLSKTAFLLNMDYYGWVKSVALSVAGDILEDHHGIFSIHGACLDYNGIGFSIVGLAGMGKTTNAYGLLRNNKIRVISDDWFFVRPLETGFLAFSSEKNFYIRADLAEVWPEFSGLVKKALVDKKGRAIVNLRWVIGKGRIIPMTTLRIFLILVREKSVNKVYWEIEPEEALSMLAQNGYYNPHLLVRDDRKKKLRSEFFLKLLEMTENYVVNTAATPHETQQAILKIVESYNHSRPSTLTGEG